MATWRRRFCAACNQPVELSASARQRHDATGESLSAQHEIFNGDKQLQIACSLQLSSFALGAPQLEPCCKQQQVLHLAQLHSSCSHGVAAAVKTNLNMVRSQVLHWPFSNKRNAACTCGMFRLNICSACSCVCSALAPQLQCTCCHCLVVMVALQAAIMKPVSNAVYTVITADEALELVLAIVQTMTRASSRFNQSVSWCLKLGIGAGGFSWGATNKWCQRFASTQDVHHIAMTHYSAAVWCVAPQHQLYVEHCR